MLGALKWHAFLSQQANESNPKAAFPSFVALGK